MTSDAIADYVIVGAGSAGCVLANRLSADPSVRVLLLEAGGADRSPWIHIPVGYFKTMGDPRYDWRYKTEPDPGLAGRAIDWPRGKTLGGSSSINGLLYVRGQPEDYERWRQMGNAGWGWDEVLPLFKRAEDQERGEDERHGIGGPIAVSDVRLRWPICDAWHDAAQAAGHAANPDYNGANQEGVSYFQQTARKGRRCSTAVGYLRPAMRRPNLDVRKNAQVERLLIEEGRVVGVRYRDAAGAAHEARAAGEVLLSAGAIGSPQILMLSGLGDGAHLMEVGLETLRHKPAIGAHMQDHLQARLIFGCNTPTMNDELRSFLGQAKAAAQYALFRTGPMTLAASLITAFVKTRPELATPDIQFHIQPFSADMATKTLHDFSAFTASVCQLRPESRGDIRLKSKDPNAHPAIRPNYLATENDQRTMIDAVDVARRIAEHDPLRDKIEREREPGPEIAGDDAVLQWIRETATTIYHPTGTCRMGPDDDAVVDHRLRFKGLDGLRVVDASIMPEIVSGNTNAPTIMIAEKAADMIREDRKN